MKSTGHFRTFDWLRNGLIYILLLVALCAACTPKPVQSTVEKYQLSCGLSHGHSERHLHPLFVISWAEDSLADTTLRFANNEMYTPLDSAFSRDDLTKFFLENLAYPEMMRELEIQGVFYYAMHFKNGIFSSYHLLRSPPEARLLELEIEKHLKKQLQMLQYTTRGNNKLVVRFHAKLIE